MNRSTQHAFEPEEIMAYLDGELEPRQAASLASHLEHCIECRALAAQLRQVSDRLLEFEIEPCPSKAAEPVMAALDAASRKHQLEPKPSAPPRRRRGIRILAWATASVGVLFVIYMVSVPFLLRPRMVSEKSVAFIREHADPERRAPQEGMSAENSRLSDGSAALSSRGRLFSDLQTLTTPGIAGDSNGLVNGSGHGGGSSGEPDADRVGGLREEGYLAGNDSDKNLSKGTSEPEIKGPMIVETASMRILAANFDQASSQIQPLTAARGGYVQDLTADTRTGAARSLSGTLRVPDKQLEAFVADLRKLGHVEQETRDNQEVTGAYVDLTARLKTARATEQRIIELLGTRTGKLPDVLEAEEELDRVRGDIESMDGQRVNMEHQVRYATVQVQLNEEYREQLNPESFSTGRRLRNSLVEGLSNLAGGITGAAIFAFAYGPSILFWLAVAGLPAWFVWRRVRKTKRLAP